MPVLHIHTRDLQYSFATLQHKRLCGVFAAHEQRVLLQDQRAELGLVIQYLVRTIRCAAHDGVGPRHTDVVGHTHLRVLAPADFYGQFVRRVHNVKCFGVLLGGQRLKYYEVRLWVLYCHHVDDLILVGDLEREVLLAQLAIQLLELDYDLLSVCLLRAFGLKPAT